MSPQEIIETLEKKANAITGEDFYDYFPQMIDDLLDIEENIVENIFLLSLDDQVEYNYDIHYLMIKYYMELIKVYSKEKYHISLKYDFEEILSVGGRAGYDEKKDMIHLTVIGMLFSFTNTCSYLKTLLHEFRHKLQHDFYKEKDLEKCLNYPAYFFLIGKQYFFTKYQSDVFYSTNYTNLYSEVDAEEYSSNEIENIIPFLYHKYQERRETSKELEDKVSKVMRIIKENCTEIKAELKRENMIQTPISDELYHSHNFTSVFLVDQDLIDSITAINQFIKEHPELQEKFPILQLLWGNNQLKDYGELMQSKEKLLEEIPNIKITPIDFDYPTTTHSQIEELYQTIVRTDPSLQIGEKPKQKTKR